MVATDRRGYFQHVPKVAILEAVGEFAPEHVTRLAKLKKGDIASEAERLADGTGWMPAIFAVEATQQTAQEVVTDEEAEAPAVAAGADEHRRPRRWPRDLAPQIAPRFRPGRFMPRIPHEPRHHEPPHGRDLCPGTIRARRWHGDSDVRGYRPPRGWTARADLTDLHPITGRALPRAVWYHRNQRIEQPRTQAVPPWVRGISVRGGRTRFQGSKPKRPFAAFGQAAGAHHLGAK